MRQSSARMTLNSTLTAAPVDLFVTQDFYLGVGCHNSSSGAGASVIHDLHSMTPTSLTPLSVTSFPSLEWPLVMITSLSLSNIKVNGI